MTDIKQICTQLIELWDADCDADSDFYFTVKLNELRAALAEPEPDGPNNEPQIGDYVLATKWSDGDPCDHFCVGFFAGKDRDRYKVVDSDGNLFRGNGFRRCETITQKEGESILSLKIGDKPGPSVWWHLERIRGIEVQPEPEGPTDEELLCIAAKSIEPYDQILPGEYEPETNSAVEVYGSELIIYARAVLARWGRPKQKSKKEQALEDFDFLMSQEGLESSSLDISARARRVLQALESLPD